VNFLVQVFVSQPALVQNTNKWELSGLTVICGYYNILIFNDKFDISRDFQEQLECYTRLLLRWNSRIQLTATRNESEFVERHIVDSLELASELDHSHATMIDVGSGGGLPGIVLSIVRPKIQFTLIEPTKKKHAFLSTVRRELGLTNLRTLPIRDTEMRARADFERFDYAVARAVWSLDIWFERAKALVVPGGTVFGMGAAKELSIPEGCARRVYQLQDRQRSIVSWMVPGNPQ